jgi:hypothetical protein
LVDESPRKTHSPLGGALWGTAVQEMRGTRSYVNLGGTNH